MNAITAKGISKKFFRQNIFSNISFEAKQGDSIAITGYNGSGKSTLLQIIAGYISLTNGNVEYIFNDKKINPDELYRYVSLAAPYLELIEDFTLPELISFYTKFKAVRDIVSVTKTIEMSQPGFSTEKPIKYYSSGMKQRVKIALALMTDVPFVFLDEPLSNLDENGIEWFRNLMTDKNGSKIIFICSNRVKEEINFCSKFINLEEYKQS